MCNKIITIKDGKKLEALQSGGVYKDCNNDDQFYRRKYRLALCEIKELTAPYKDNMGICGEINKVLKRAGI